MFPFLEPRGTFFPVSLRYAKVNGRKVAAGMMLLLMIEYMALALALQKGVQAIASSLVTVIFARKPSVARKDAVHRIGKRPR